MHRILVAGAMLAVFLLAGAPAAAQGSGQIEELAVRVTVADDNTYHVEQNLRVRFSGVPDKSGLTETIALKPVISVSQDGREYRREEHVDIAGLLADPPVETRVSAGHLTLLVDGTGAGPDAAADCSISFDYHVGDDGFRDVDAFAFPLTGGSWNVPVDTLSFRIEMPQDVSAQDIRIAKTEGNDVRFEAEGNVISGRLQRTLAPGETPEIQIVLPPGYFAAASGLRGAGLLCIWSAAGLAGLGVLIFFWNRTSQKTPVQAVDVPPAGLTPADLGFVADGVVKDREVIALLLYWAQEGALQIVEESSGGEPEFLFIRLRDLPLHAVNYEKLLFGELFKHGDRITSRELRGRFRAALADAKHRIRTRFTQVPDCVYSPRSISAAEVCMLLSPVPAALTLAMAGYYSVYSSAAAVIFGLLGYFSGALLSWWYWRIQDVRRTPVHSSRGLRPALWAALAAAYLGTVCSAGSLFLGPYVLAVAASTALLAAIAPWCRQRTQHGRSWLAQVLGLRLFLTGAGTGKAPAVRDGAKYLELLPYAEALGLGHVWSGACSQGSKPAWYTGQVFSGAALGAKLAQALGEAEDNGRNVG